MSRTTIAAWFVCVLLSLLMYGAVGRAGEQALPTEVILAVEFKGAEHFSTDELQRYTNMAIGSKYDAAQASDDCTVIVRHYQEHGYPFATCCQSVSRESALAVGFRFEKLTYTITEGPKVKVRHVEFIGNTFVGADVLAEQLQSHKRGSSRTNFAQVPEDVIRLTEYYRAFGYFDVVVSYELQWNLDGGEATMMFHIHEGERHK